MTLDNQILQLTSLWYEYVSIDHHKDCDCHWIIEKKYSYGNNPTYNVLHYGYITDDVDIKCGTLSEAHKELIQAISKAFSKEKEWADGVLKSFNDWDEYQHISATWLMDHWGRIKKLAGKI